MGHKFRGDIVSLHVTFYNNTSDSKVMNKNISPIVLSGESTIVAELTPTQAVDVLNPVLIIDYRPQLIGANYCKINEYNRYYYCKFATDTGGRMIVSCKVDHLMSFSASIGECKINVVRNSVKPSYVADSSLPIDPNRYYTEGIKFPFTKFTNRDLEGGYPYILVVR